jgi:hypothetical protein
LGITIGTGPSCAKGSTPIEYAAASCTGGNASGGDAAKKNECRASMGRGCTVTGTKTGLGTAPLAANR